MTESNRLQHFWAQHVASVWPPCCDMLGVVGSHLIYLIFKLEPTTLSMSQHIATRWPNARRKCSMSLLTMLQWHVAIVWWGSKTISLVDTPPDVLVRQCFKPRPNDCNISTQHNLDNVGPAIESSGKKIASFE